MDKKLKKKTVNGENKKKKFSNTHGESKKNEDEELKPDRAEESKVEDKDSLKEEAKEDSCREDEKKEKDVKDIKIEELQDKLLRSQAEFDNFRRRSEKEKSDMFGGGALSVLEKIVPVIDNFERGLESADDTAFAEGMRMIYKQLMTSLNEMGVSEIEALGETFDPDYHNAVMHEDNEEAGENEITQVLQKGYKYNDSIIRHSMVKVAN